MFKNYLLLRSTHERIKSIINHDLHKGGFHGSKLLTLYINVDNLSIYETNPQRIARAITTPPQKINTAQIPTLQIRKSKPPYYP